MSSSYYVIFCYLSEFCISINCIMDVMDLGALSRLYFKLRPILYAFRRCFRDSWYFSSFDNKLMGLIAESPHCDAWGLKDDLMCMFLCI